MLFNSFDFAFFFIAITCLYFVLPYRFRWVLLLAGSCLFYMWWRWEYIFLIVTETVLNFYYGRRIARSEDVVARKLWLAAALVCSLGLLFFFKYYGFASESVKAAGSVFGLNWSLPALDILLPVGISFYTFQALTYSIDVYRRQIGRSNTWAALPSTSLSFHSS